MPATLLTDELYDNPLSDWAEAIATRIADERSKLVLACETEGNGEIYDLSAVLYHSLGENWQADLGTLRFGDVEALVLNYLNANPWRIEPLVGTLVIETEYFSDLD